MEYLILCQADGFCYVFNHETYIMTNLQRDNPGSYRKINVSIGFSKIQMMEYEQFLLVSYPTGKSVAIYPMPEAGCRIQ